LNQKVITEKLLSFYQIHENTQNPENEVNPRKFLF